MSKEITNNDLFEFMTKMYGEMKEIKEDVKKLDKRMDNIEKEVAKTNATIDHDIKPKISALFDGYAQNTEQLNRIEEHASKQDEIIIRRIK